jgi:hypothetical protein
VRCSACGQSVSVDTMVEHSARCFVDLAGDADDTHQSRKWREDSEHQKRSEVDDSAGASNGSVQAGDRNKAELQAVYFAAVANANSRAHQTPPRPPSSTSSNSQTRRRRSGGILTRFGLDFSCAAAIPSCPAPGCSAANFGGIEDTQAIDRGITIGGSTPFRMPGSPQTPGSGARRRGTPSPSPAGKRRGTASPSPAALRR